MKTVYEIKNQVTGEIKELSTLDTQHLMGFYFHLLENYEKLKEEEGYNELLKAVKYELSQRRVIMMGIN